jgi:signal transduction histidine kinase
MRARTASRLAWSLWGLIVALVAVGLLSVFTRPTTGESWWSMLAVLMVLVAYPTVGAWIASRRHDNPIGWVFIGGSLSMTLAIAANEWATRGLVVAPGSLPGAVWFAWAATWVWFLGLGLFAIFGSLLFPTGRVPSPRWRWVAWLGGIGVFAGAASYAFRPGVIESFGDHPNPLGIEGALRVLQALEVAALAAVALAVVGATASVVVRFRRARGEERQQLKWYLYAVAIAGLGIVVGSLSEPLSPTLAVVAWNVGLLGLVGMPVAAAVAIFKYRLYDIDVVINKTVVYGALAAFVTLVYVGVVVGVGALVGSRGNLFLSILATAVIALAFHPVRQWARRLANRVVYGKRATPYEVLSRFSERMAGTYSAEDVLPRMARLLGEGTGAAETGVWLRVGAQFRREAAWPEDGSDQRPVDASGDTTPAILGADRTFPVAHEGDVLGALTIRMPRGEPFSPTSEGLVRNLASQAGLVLRNARLIEDLRASRQRLVAAQDEERRRLERNIHDGAQQQLVALSMRMRLLKTLTRKDPAKAEDLVDQLQADARDALDDLRDLARGIYPPLLADKGLAAALEAQARKVPFPVQVEPNGVGRYPAEAEATAYFCVLEALQNAAKYADASSALVRLGHEDGDLVFSVTDDGKGFDPATTPRGSGLQNMVDRVDALGGRIDITSSSGTGTTITGWIPVGTGALSE